MVSTARHGFCVLQIAVASLIGRSGSTMTGPFRSAKCARDIIITSRTQVQGGTLNNQPGASRLLACGFSVKHNDLIVKYA